jgi:hypothetical protein
VRGLFCTIVKEYEAMPQQSLQVLSKPHRVKKKAGKTSVKHSPAVRQIAARLADLSPEALRTLADVVQDLLKSHDLGNGEDLFDEELHLLAGKIAGKNPPTLQEVRRSLAKIPGSLTAEFIAERGER